MLRMTGWGQNPEVSLALAVPVLPIPLPRRVTASPSISRAVNPHAVRDYSDLASQGDLRPLFDLV
jgi:hypothetical protein